MDESKHKGQVCVHLKEWHDFVKKRPWASVEAAYIRLSIEHDKLSAELRDLKMAFYNQKDEDGKTIASKMATEFYNKVESEENRELRIKLQNAEKERDAYLENLTSVQKRCTELSEANRRLRLLWNGA